MPSQRSRVRRGRRPLLAALVLALALALAACGGGGARKTTIILDYVPNAVHVPLYTAVAQGIDRRHGLRLALQAPGSTSDTLKLVAAGKADFGIADLIDLSLARLQGEPLVAVAALVQRPTGSVLTLASGPITRPRDLEGKRVGLTGVPSDPAIVGSVIRADGGDPGKVHFVTIGFNAVQSLIGGSVDASIGFWPAEGVDLTLAGHPARAFRLDAFGAPPFPELVLFTRASVVADHPDEIADLRAILADGIAAALADPARGLADLEAGAKGVDPAEAKAQLAAYATIFAPAGTRAGVLDPATLSAFASWGQRAGLLPSALDTKALLAP